MGEEGKSISGDWRSESSQYRTLRLFIVRLRLSVDTGVDMGVDMGVDGVYDATPNSFKNRPVVEAD